MKSKFNKICIWQGVGLYNNPPEKFESFFKSIGFRVKFIKLLHTKTGGVDLAFYVHDDDVQNFRLSNSMQWFN